MKKILFAFLLTVLFLLMVIPCHAQSDVIVYVNGKKVSFDQAPTIIDGRTLVPARVIAEMFNANITWNDSTKTAIITKKLEGSIVTSEIQIGDNVITVEEYKISSNNTYPKKVELDVPAMILNGRTMLPLRGISSALFEGCIWNANTRTIYLGRTPLSSSVALSDSVITDIKTSAMSIAKNALKNPNSAIFSDWEIERTLTNSGYWIYCTVKSTEGTDYMCFSFDEKDSFYQCKGAFANTEYYDNCLDVVESSHRYIFCNDDGQTNYISFETYSSINPNNCMPIVTEVYDANAKAQVTTNNAK